MNRKINLGIVCNPMPGGDTSIALSLGEEMANRGHEVHVISGGEVHTPVSSCRRPANLKLHIVKSVEHPVLEYTPFTLTLASKIIEVTEDYGLDLYHAHFAVPYATCTLLARLSTKVPYCVTCHGSDVHTIGKLQDIKRGVALSLKKANGLTSPTRFLKYQIRQILKLRKRVWIIPNFVDVTKFQRLKVQRPGKVVLHVTNFTPVKRVDKVLRVFSLVQKQVSCARLWLVGDGPERPKAQAMATSLGLRNVSFLGTRHDMDRVYSRADLLLMTSDLENMPLAMLEAMSCELPVVSSDVGGIPEFVKHGSTGFLHNLRRSEIMVSTVAKLLKNEGLRRSIGQRAREAVIKSYSSNIIVSKYEEFYRTTLGV